MIRILTVTTVTLSSVIVYGQNAAISQQDSALLNKFWARLRVAISTSNKARLAEICEFPFYCRPCLDYTKIKKTETIKVTKTLFYESQYKLFFDKPFKEKVNSYNGYEKSLFFPSYDQNSKPIGFNFFYTIVAPSKNWEGSQGFVYLKKIKGQYKIIGLDTVP